MDCTGYDIASNSNEWSFNQKIANCRAQQTKQQSKWLGLQDTKMVFFWRQEQVLPDVKAIGDHADGAEGRCL